MRACSSALLATALVLALASGASNAGSDITFVGWPGNGQPLPTISPGTVESGDDTYTAPSGSCTNIGTTPQNYDSLVFTNAGNTTETIVYRVADANDNCDFPAVGGTPALNSVRLVAYRGTAGTDVGQGPFNPASPATNCVQAVSAGSGNCPTVSVTLAAFQAATFVISTSNVPRPGPTRPEGGGGLFGYHGGLGGSSPVTLQSFSVGQGD